jgi:xanthine dehydrogenase molybdenum-binding subunit
VVKPAARVRGPARLRIRATEQRTARLRIRATERRTARLRIRATVNGEPIEALCEPHESLLDMLRDDLGLTGAKEGCNDGNCGACSVLLDGRVVNSCLVLAAEVEGREVVTVEGLADWPALHPLQRAFIAEDALQCGFCTPGVLITAKALLDRVPDPTDREIRCWLAGNLCRCTGYESIVRAVRAAAKEIARTRRGSAKARSGPAAGAPAPSASGARVIGTRPARVDAPEKVTGRALFGADVRLPGTVVGRILRSPHAHARIVSIDTRKAESLPGVLAVVTAADLPPLKDCGSRSAETTQDLRFARDNTLAGGKVLYQGHPIAAVAARSAATAEEALRLIRVDYEVLPAVLDVMEAMRADAPRLHDRLVSQASGLPAAGGHRPGNVAHRFRLEKGDPERAFARAEVVVEREFRTTMVHQGYLEPQAATAVWGPDGTLTVYASTQGSFALRQQIADLLDLPMTRLRVVPTEVGGGFGSKNQAYVEVPAALLAVGCGRPVRIVMSRAEVLMATGPTPGTVIRVKMGTRRDGRICAAAAELYYEAGAYPGSPVSMAAEAMFSAYDIPDGRIDGYDVVVNKPKAGFYRAPGVTPASFAVEQVVDELAGRLGIDPLEFRLANSARDGTRLISGGVHTDIGAREVLEAARASPHYAAPLRGPHRGRGVAHATWGNWGAQSSCVMSLNSDGTVAMVTGSVDLTGTRTSLAMQAAAVLGLPVDRIRPRVGDTDETGYTDTSAGSRTTVATGLAVIKASRELLERLRERAAILLETAAGEVRYADGVFTLARGGKKLSFAELAARMEDTGGPVSVAGSVNMGEWGAAFGTHIVDVEVDPETGRVKILRYTAVQDVGRAIHPPGIEGQMRGGVAQGIGWALFEGYAYDAAGRLLNANLLDNRLPTALDVPPIETVIVEVPSKHHPFGARGVGEMPIVPPPAAIANAIAAATGVRLTRLPMTPALVLEAMGVIH